jgi:hypothetical protein
MTAFDLIDSIYSRPHAGKLAGNERWITERQFAKLRELIRENEEGSALTEGMNGGFAWTPSGRNKYVVSVYPGDSRRETYYKLMRLANIVPSGMGRLF